MLLNFPQEIFACTSVKIIESKAKCLHKSYMTPDIMHDSQDHINQVGFAQTIVLGSLVHSVITMEQANSHASTKDLTKWKVYSSEQSRQAASLLGDSILSPTIHRINLIA